MSRYIPSHSRIPPTVQSKLYLLWVRLRSAVFSPLAPPLLREICSYLSVPPLLLTFACGQVYAYNPVTNSPEFLCTNRSGDEFVSGVMMGEGRALLQLMTRVFHDSDLELCAYDPYEYSERYSYWVFDALSETFSYLNFPDVTGVGLVYDQWRNRAYLFGGWDEKGRSRKCAAVRSQQQLSYGSDNEYSVEKLRVMKNARADFTPCWYGARVYLCGGGSPTVETYDPQLKSFAVFPELVLPFDSSTVLSFVHGHSLIVLSRKRVLRYDLQSSRSVFVRQFTSPVDVCTESYTVEAQGIVYFVSEEQCIGVSAETGEVATSVMIPVFAYMHRDHS